MPNILDVRNLVVWFDSVKGTVKALDGVNFSIKAGEIFGLAGETGCGKSVTALSIIRLLAENGYIKEGIIEFKGQNLLEISEKEMAEKIRGNEISMVFQDPEGSWDPVYTIGYQFVETIKRNIGLSDNAAQDETQTMLKNVRIGNPQEVSNSYSFQLSGGMNQRSMIGMMLSADPSLLIADEPTTALDVTIQGQLLNLLKRLKESRGMTILLITHDLAVVAEICDRVGMMYGGTIVEIADTVTLFENPMHPYTKGLMNAIPRKGKESGKLYTISGIVPEAIDPPSGCRFHPRCEFSKDICTQQKPEQMEVENEHYVACHLSSTSNE